MRWSRYFIPTMKESPKDAETASHKLMFRAGCISKVSAGVYSYLPLGLRVLRNVERIVREEMNRTGALEVLLPALQPATLWKETGRWEKMGKDMVTFIDRHEREMILGPTHEEVITDLVRQYIRSWKHLPVTFYQIQTKFRDEIRPRFGVIRSREFLMKDAYSFDPDEKGLDAAYERMRAAYSALFARCGLSVTIQNADSGVIGGKFSEEFVAAGECSELEVGHIFKLGTEYSTAMKAVYIDAQGAERPAVMGCYGIGVSRIVAAVIEGSNDAKGIIWPFSVAPFHVLVIPTNPGDEAIRQTADRIADDLTAQGLEVLLDDRTGSPGVKFSDGDLIGIPLWVVVGKKLAAGKVEIKRRKEQAYEEVAADQAPAYIASAVAAFRATT